jgi:glycerol kinase
MAETKGPYFLGIDVGTQGLRSGIFDLRGNVVALSFYSYPEYHPRPGWAEQDPIDWDRKQNHNNGTFEYKREHEYIKQFLSLLFSL